MQDTLKRSVDPSRMMSRFGPSRPLRAFDFAVDGEGPALSDSIVLGSCEDGLLRNLVRDLCQQRSLHVFLKH